MDLFHSCIGGEIDLDDPSVYRAPFWDDLKTVMDMRSFAWSMIGRSFVYMDYIETWEGHSWEPQRSRVVEFAKTLTSEFHNRAQNTEENLTWWRKFIFKFEDEVENQC